jgi:hypothetical protein
LRLTRRVIVRNGLLAALFPSIGKLGRREVASAAAAAEAGGQELKWRHGLSLFGELKYLPGFERFDYANPDAPKLGAVRITAFGTFDNFNEVVAGVKGSLAMRARVICARAASGHAATPLPRSAMNCRRLIWFTPRPKDHGPSIAGLGASSGAVHRSNSSHYVPSWVLCHE